MERPNWDEFYFEIAFVYATRGTCNRLRTACIIVDENHMLVGAGYNGSVPGTPHCDEVGHLMVDGHCVRTLHGEENAILHCTKDDLSGATAYILGTPCIDCLKKFLTKGVKIIKYAGKYSNAKGKEAIDALALEAGAELIHCDINFENLHGNVLKIHEGTGGRLKKRL